MHPQGMGALPVCNIGHTRRQVPDSIHPKGPKCQRLLSLYKSTEGKLHLRVGRVLAGGKHVELIYDLHYVRAKGAKHQREVPPLRSHADLSERVLAQRSQVML